MASSQFFGKDFVEEEDITSLSKVVGVILGGLVIPIVVLLLFKGYRKTNRNDEQKSSQSKTGDVRMSRWWWQSLLSPVYMVWYLYKFRKGGLKFFEDYVAEHGPVSRITSSVYVIADTNVIRKILSSTNPLHLNKTNLAGVVFRLGGIKDGLVAADPEIWAPHRKLLTPSFSYKSLKTYIACMNRNANEMVEALYTRFQEVSGRGGSSSISGHVITEIIDFHMIKMISSVVLGADDMVKDQKIIKFGQDFQKAKELCMFRLYRPWFISETIWQWHPYCEELERSRGGTQQFVKDLIVKYKEQQQQDEKVVKVTKMKIDDEEDGLHQQQQHHSMIQDMLGSSGMSEYEILTEVLTFLIAGHESTTTQITLLLLHLALNPVEQSKCYDEINQLIPEPSKDPFLISMDELSNLKHLERCVYESLRLTPVFPMIMRRIESPLDVDDSLQIEAQSDILIPVWSVHRNKDVFKEPHKFDPDRFLPENTMKRDRFAFIPFSSGPRNCIGWKLALMEIKVVVAWLLRNFQVQTGDHVSMNGIKWVFDGALKADGGVDLRLKKRREIFNNFVN